MRTIIVTPLYYISRNVRSIVEDNKENKITFIITDDASPIIPLEYRMDWIDYTFMDENIEIESIVQSDESEEFADAVDAKIKYITRDDGEKPNVIVFLSDISAKIPSLDVASCKSITLSGIEDALSDEEDFLDDVYRVRFLPQLRRFARPKEKSIPKEREYIVIPYTDATKKMLVEGVETEVTHRYYAFLKDYPNEKLDTIQSKYVASDVDTMTARKYAVVTTSVYLDLEYDEIQTTTFKGTYHGKDVWFLNVGANKCNPESPFGLRKYLAPSADIIFIRQDMLVDALNEFGAWVYYLDHEPTDD